jgi:transposase-like protein
MKQRRDPVSAEVRRAALTLLKDGKATLPEVAALAGVSTHSVWNWCREAKVDWRAARQRRIGTEWLKLNR